LFTKEHITRLFTGGLKVALPVFAFFVGVFFYTTLKSNRPVPPNPQKREAVQPVRTQEVLLASLQPVLRLYGEVKAGRKVELRALVAGKVLKTGDHFREGAQVNKGDLLLTIDPFTYEGAVVEARARIVEARARLKEIRAQITAEEDSIQYALEQLKLAKLDLERAKKLVKRGSVTRQGAEQRQLIVSQRRQTLDGKQANLLILRAKAEQQLAGIDSLEWRLRQAERNRRDTRLNAPFNGYITDVNANEGRLLNVNDRVAVLLDSHWMDVVFTLSDRQYGRLIEGKNGLIGRAVKVTWKLGVTPLSYGAIIERIGAQITSETGGVTVYAKLKDPSLPRPIRTGAFVDIDVPDRIYHKVVRLPQTALYGRSRVYVVGPSSRLQERVVKLQALDGEFVLVSGNFKNGERVVITRMSTIGPGMKVQDLRQDSNSAKKTKSAGSVSEVEKKSQRGGLDLNNRKHQNRG
jgi:RND family efflux transporter MFP subunit